MYFISTQNDDQYTEVRHGPRYTPKSQRGASPPPPAKPMRTDRPDYDSTANVMSGRGGGDYDSTRSKGGGGGGLAELDNLLDMLSTTQETQPPGVSRLIRQSWLCARDIFIVAECSHITYLTCCLQTIEFICSLIWA